MDFEQMKIISERENKREDDTTEKNDETEKRCASKVYPYWHVR